MRPQLLEPLLEVGALLLALTGQIFLGKNLEVLQSRGAGRRVAAEGDQVTHGGLFVLLKNVMDRVAHDGGRDRGVAGGETLRQRHDVGYEAELLRGEHRAGAAEP